MADINYLDYSGVSRLVEKIKNTYATKDELQEAIDDITPEEYGIYYGIEFDTTISSPTCTRIGNTDFHKTLPIQNKMRGCLLDNDGNVVEYLDSSDWNNSTELGDDLRVFLPNGTIVEATLITDAYINCYTTYTTWKALVEAGLFTPAEGSKYLYTSQSALSATDLVTSLVEYTSATEYTITECSANTYYVSNGKDATGSGSDTDGASDGYYDHLFKVTGSSGVTEATDMGCFNGRRDGLRGQVMVEIPEHFRKFETDGTKRRVKVSTVKFKGSHKVPKMYVSAYEAALDRTNSKLASVVNTDAQYRGGNNKSDWDNTYRSLLGRPATQISRTNFRKYARNRKSGSTEWNCMTYDAQKTLYWLFVIEYATLNSQAAYNSALTTEGYRQGGLGDGVTTWNGTSWNNFNGNNPFVPCGITDSLGNKTGVVEYTVTGEDGGTLKTFQVPRYRGIENPFGHIWQWTDGINVRISPTTENGGDGLSKVFVCSDPSKFNDSNYTGYSHVGNEARSGGYVKEIIFGEYGEIMPKVVGGGSTTYFCDYHYTNIPTTEQLRGFRLGGAANVGAGAGLVCADSDAAPSAMGISVGTRLCFIPE